MSKDKQEETALELLQRIDGRLERFEERFPQIERKALAYGAAAGALSGGLVACGVLVARMKLGI
jgi:hypothetical protein